MEPGTDAVEVLTLAQEIHAAVRLARPCRVREQVTAGEECNRPSRQQRARSNGEIKAWQGLGRAGTLLGKPEGRRARPWGVWKRCWSQEPPWKVPASGTVEPQPWSGVVLGVRASESVSKAPDDPGAHRMDLPYAGVGGPSSLPPALPRAVSRWGRGEGLAAWRVDTLIPLSEQGAGTTKQAWART